MGAIDDLPEIFRIFRDARHRRIESCGDGGFLNLPQAAVKTGLLRARRLLHQALSERLASALVDAFPCGGMRCTRMADRIFERLGFSSPSVG
jgi:hypothetical protein